MYFMGQIWGCSFIFNTTDEYLTIGPFESESDGHLMCELLNSGRLTFGKGGSDVNQQREYTEI